MPARNACSSNDVSKKCLDECVAFERCVEEMPGGMRAVRMMCGDGWRNVWGSNDVWRCLEDVCGSKEV